MQQPHLRTTPTKLHFEQFEIGYASAIVMAQFIVFLGVALTILQIRKIMRARG